jgi:DNA (cytosine-5)-methyltransferase 1
MTGVDLFAGAGGFSIGMEEAGIKVVAAVEFDHNACETLRINQPRYHKDMLIVEADIKTVSGPELLSKVGLKVGELDILFGGPPCQGFSLSNKNRSINDPRSKLMYEFVRMTREMQPRVIYVENVPGCFAFKDFFFLLMETYENCGYVTRCLMMDAAGYGVPQRRKRIFIQGMREDLKIVPTFPPPTNFAPEQLKVKKDGLLQPAEVAIECFAVNGFPKEEIKDLWWNESLGIQMNRKTAGNRVDEAINNLIAQKVYGLARSIAGPIQGTLNFL